MASRRRNQGFWARVRSFEGSHRTPRKIEVRPDSTELVSRLSRAEFPLRSRALMISALGGKGAIVRVRGMPPMTSEEIADLCFAEQKSFRDPWEVENALNRSSWTRAILRLFHLSWFPLKGPNRLAKFAGNIRIDGVSIRNLATSLEYPVTSTTELLEKLARARSKYGT